MALSDKNNQGIIYLSAAAFVGVSLMLAVLIQRKVATVSNVYIHDTFLISKTNPDHTRMALSNALQALMTGQPSALNYTCDMTTTSGGKSENYFVEYKKDVNDWNVKVDKDNKANSNSCPKTF